MNKGLALIILITILVFGSFLRLLHINDESLWLDEGITYYNSSGESYSEVWDKTADLDQSPPFYYFIMHTYLEIFGENEFGFRLIPVIFGILSILFLYLLLSEMFEMEVGLIAAFLLAINPFHIGFSIESRMYVLLSLEALIGFYALYKAIDDDKGSYIWWILFMLMCVFGIYTHNFFFFVLLAFAFVFFLLLMPTENKIGKFLMGLLSALVVCVSYIPWIGNFLKQLSVDRYWMAENSLSDLKNYFLDFSNQNKYIFIGFIGLFILGIFWTFIRIKSVDYKKGLFASLSLMIFLIIGFGVPLIYSLGFEPIMKIRYVVYLVPIWLSIAALGIYAIRRWSVVFSFLILIGITYLLMPINVSAYPLEIGEDYRRLTEIVAQKNDPLIVHTPSIAHVINFYNQGRFKIKPFPYSDDLTEFNIDESSKNKFMNLIENFNSFFLVITHSHETPGGLLYIWSDEKCETSYEIAVSGMETYYFTDCKL